MAEMIRASRSIFFAGLASAVIIGLAGIGAGVWLVLLGATGNTEFSLLGNSFRSENVGAVGIFCGVMVIVLTVRRAFKTIENIGRDGDDHDDDDYGCDEDDDYEDEMPVAIRSDR